MTQRFAPNLQFKIGLVDAAIGSAARRLRAPVARLRAWACQVRQRCRSVKSWGLFNYWYASSYFQRDKIDRLGTSIRNTFDHPWVCDVDLEWRRRNGGSMVEGRLVHWDAPIAVLIFRKSKRRRHVAFCMSCYVAGDVISIMQIQGVFAVDIPAALRNWPQLFVQSCQSFAEENNLRQVRVAKASSLYSYHNATVRGDTQEAIDKARAQIQQRMRGHYDGTAKELGFVETGRWLIWSNPKHRP